MLYLEIIDIYSAWGAVVHISYSTDLRFISMGILQNISKRIELNKAIYFCIRLLKLSKFE